MLVFFETSYRLVYDIREIRYAEWWMAPFSVIPFLISARAAIGFRMNKFVDLGAARRWRSIMIANVLFGFLWAGLSLMYYLPYRDLQNAVGRGDYETTEGQIIQFVPMRGEGHSPESFVVNGQQLSYSDYRLSKLFGGFLHNGLQVRVSYVGDTMVRLEIGQPVLDKIDPKQEPNLSGKPGT